MRKGTKNSRLVLLWEVEFEYNSGSEYERTETEYIWETTLKKAQKYAKWWLKDNGFKWSKEMGCFESTQGMLYELVKISSIGQTTFLPTLNGTSLNIGAIGNMLEYNKHSNSFFEKR